MSGPEPIDPFKSCRPGCTDPDHVRFGGSIHVFGDHGEGTLPLREPLTLAELEHIGDVMHMTLISIRGALRDAGLLNSIDIEVLQMCIDELRKQDEVPT